MATAVHQEWQRRRAVCTAIVRAFLFSEKPNL